MGFYERRSADVSVVSVIAKVLLPFSSSICPVRDPVDLSQVNVIAATYGFWLISEAASSKSTCGAMPSFGLR
jgi:hypothetical protein